MARSFPTRVTRFAVLPVLVSTLFVLASTFVAVASPQNKGGNRGGGGVGIGLTIDVTPLLNQPQRRQPQPQRTTTSCRKPLVYSKRSGRCVCPTSRGYVFTRGKCVRRKPPTNVVRKPPVDVTRIQECLQKAGFDAGPADGSAGPKTIEAFRQFQQANGFSKGLGSLRDKASTNRLFEICDATPVPAATRQASAPQPDNCIPRDLYDMLTASYGSNPNIRACPNACLPKPEFFSEARVQSIGAQFNINWCGNCVRLTGWLPLAEILNMERLTGRTMCVTPLAQCVVPASYSGGGYTKVRTIFKTLPTSVRKPGDIAVVIGNEIYNKVPLNENGDREAGAVRTLLLDQLGYSEENIIDVRNATLTQLEEIFGTTEKEGSLSKRLASDQQGDVFIYVSSHGLADEAQSRGHILPVDSDFDKTGKGTYALQQLYDNLSKLGARTITLVLEMSFSTDLNQLIEPPNLPQLASSVLPETSVPGLAVFTASDRDQRTLEDPEFGIGLFTRYLIEGLAGQADQQPIGNADRRIDTVELYVYTANLVRMAARKTQGMEQKPILAKHDNLLIGRLGQR